MLSDPAKLPRKVSEYIQDHVYVTPSGLFSQRYLRWAIEVLGRNRIIIFTDHPFIEVRKGAAEFFLQEAGLTDEECRNIASGDCERICSSIMR